MTTELRRVSDRAFDEADRRVREALAEQGFGVLTEIDVRATLAAKLGVDFRRYVILGACNPGFAHRALSASLQVGTLLPCNVVLYEDDHGKTVIEAVDPVALLPAGEPALEALAREVRERLRTALERV
ncbi:MAG: DUF302 domain-containing protein [Sandaracinaceae bacterium]|nr:DUF302 domain-containing protein [Sandaracinaceae bacterium]